MGLINDKNLRAVMMTISNQSEDKRREEERIEEDM